MKVGPFDSIGLLLADLALLGAAFTATWIGGLTESLAHNAFALTAALIALFVSGRSAATSDVGSRRLLTLVVVAAMATMVTH